MCSKILVFFKPSFLQHKCFQYIVCPLLPSVHGKPKIDEPILVCLFGFGFDLFLNKIIDQLVDHEFEALILTRQINFQIKCILRTMQISYRSPVTFLCDGARPQKCYQITRRNLGVI